MLLQILRFVFVGHHFLQTLMFWRRCLQTVLGHSRTIKSLLWGFFHSPDHIWCQLHEKPPNQDTFKPIKWCSYSFLAAGFHVVNQNTIVLSASGHLCSAPSRCRTIQRGYPKWSGRKTSGRARELGRVRDGSRACLHQNPNVDGPVLSSLRCHRAMADTNIPMSDWNSECEYLE